MRFSPFLPATRLAALGVLVSLSLCASVPSRSQGRHQGGRSSKHGQQSTKHSITEREAQEARARKSQLHAKLTGLNRQMKQVRGTIHAAKATESRITESIQTVEARMERTRNSLRRVNTRLAQLTTDHVQTVQRLEETQQRLILRRRLLGNRLRETYERGPTNYTHVLLQSRDVHELMSRGYYVRRIAEKDSELIDGVKRDIVQIEAEKRRLEAQAREQKALAAEYEAQKAQYAADLAEKQQLLAGVREERAQAEEQLDDLENEANEMTERIRSLSEMLQRRREAQRAQQAQPSRGRHPDTRAERGDEGDVAPVWHGSFIRPSSGSITSGFGYRYHPILHVRKMHTGVDFGAPSGAPIRAAGGGTVILATYTRGYGNCVIIDHGNGVTTLYGHCSELLVSEGQTVTQGQTIARVGATGMATGPHLHFEVRHNGVPVPPLGG